MTIITSPRWRRRPGTKKFYDVFDNFLFKLAWRTPEAMVEEVDKIARDYLELGNAAADLRDTLGTSEREATARLAEAEQEIRHLVQRIDADPGKVVPILSADLEKAINMLMRFAQALGMQAQGALYDEVQGLASKYGMTYRAPNQSDIRKWAYSHDILGADVVTAELNPATGKMDFYPHESAREIDGTATEIHEGQDELPFPPSTRAYLLEDNDDPANWAVDEDKLEESVGD